MHLFADRLMHIFEIAFIERWKNDCVDLRPSGRKYFLFDAADRQHFTAQRDLAGHRDFPVNGFACQQGQDCRRHSHTGRWAVFRDGAFRHVYVDIVFGKEIFRDPEFLRVRARIAERRLRGFFHNDQAGTCLLFKRPEDLRNRPSRAIA